MGQQITQLMCWLTLALAMLQTTVVVVVNAQDSAPVPAPSPVTESATAAPTTDTLYTQTASPTSSSTKPSGSDSLFNVTYLIYVSNNLTAHSLWLSAWDSPAYGNTYLNYDYTSTYLIAPNDYTIVQFDEKDKGVLDGRFFFQLVDTSSKLETVAEGNLFSEDAFFAVEMIIVDDSTLESVFTYVDQNDMTRCSGTSTWDGDLDRATSVITGAAIMSVECTKGSNKAPAPTPAGEVTAAPTSAQSETETAAPTGASAP